MEKSKKADVIAKIQKGFQESEAVFVVTQNKMTVAATEALRKELRAANSCYFVAKNTLARIAVKGSNFEFVQPYLTNQTALVFSKDLTSSAKVIYNTASKSEGNLVITCGGYAGKLLNPDEVKTLAMLPSMDELRSKIIAIIQEPASRIARVLKSYSEKE